MKLELPIRYGMVGGGLTGKIGAIHRAAARLHGHFRLDAGAFSSDPGIAHASASALGVASERSYESYQKMAESEAAREDGIEAVVIVTPNHLHAGPCKAFLEAGMHIICDKPLTSTLADAERLHDAVSQSDRIFMLTHCYTGYPLVREARHRIQAGEIGRIRLVHVEYPQGWAAGPIERSGLKFAEWRADPERSGMGGCVADIGTHAFHLARFVSGLQVEEISAQLTSFVEHRMLDDDVQVLMRFENGGRGILWTSQVAWAQENGLSFRVFGDRGSLEWSHVDPNRLCHANEKQEHCVITRAGPAASPRSARLSLSPAGHPEGYVEAFATLYTETATAIRAMRNSRKRPKGLEFPGIDDGLEGMKFIHACIDSSAANGQWTRLN